MEFRFIEFLVEAAGLICLGKHRARHSPGGRERAGRFRSVQTASIRRLSIAGDSVRQCWGLQPQLGLPALERFPPFSARTGGCGIHCPRGDAENGGNRSNVAIIRPSLTAVALFPHLWQSTKYTCSLDVTAQAQCQRRATAGVWFGASRVTQPHVSLAQGRASQRYWLWREVRGTCVSG